MKTGIAGGKKAHSRGPTFKLSGVMVNCNSLVKAQQELEPLAKEVPAEKAERKR